MIAPPTANEAETGLRHIWWRVARWRRFLRIRAFDTATLEGRSAERYRRIAWSTLLGVIARAVSLATWFITVPLVIGYLGSERYGMWITMGSLVAAFGPLDLGVGLGLLMAVSDANGRDDRVAARRAISTAAAVLMLIAAVSAIAFALVYPAIPWAHLFNVASPAAVTEAGPASAAFFAAFALGLPLGIVGQVQLAYQSGYISSAWAIVGNLGSLVALLLVIYLRDSMLTLVVALTGGGLVAAVLNGWFLFRRQRPWLMPRRRDVDFSTARSLLRTGALFLVLQVAGLAAFGLDNLVIAQILGASMVQEYAVPARLFMLAPSLLSFALAPLWPAYRESLALAVILRSLATARTAESWYRQGTALVAGLSRVAGSRRCSVGAQCGAPLGRAGRHRQHSEQPPPGRGCAVASAGMGGVGRPPGGRPAGGSGRVGDPEHAQRSIRCPAQRGERRGLSGGLRGHHGNRQRGDLDPARPADRSGRCRLGERDRPGGLRAAPSALVCAAPAAAPPTDARGRDDGIVKPVWTSRARPAMMRSASRGRAGPFTNSHSVSFGNLWADEMEDCLRGRIDEAGQGAQVL